MSPCPEISRRTLITEAGKICGAAFVVSRLPTPNISSLLPAAHSDKKPFSSSKIHLKEDTDTKREIRWRQKGPFLVGNENQIYTYSDYFPREDRYLTADLRLEFDADSYLNLLTNLAQLTNKIGDLDNYLSNRQLRIWLNAPILFDGFAYYLAAGRWSGDPVLAYSLDEFGYIMDNAKAKIPDLTSLVGPEMLEGFPFLPGKISETDVHEAWHLLEDATLVHRIPRWTHKSLGGLLGLAGTRLTDKISRRQLLTGSLKVAALYTGATLGSYLSTPLRLLDHLKVDSITHHLINHPDIRDLPSPFRPVVLKIT